MVFSRGTGSSYITSRTLNKIADMKYLTLTTHYFGRLRSVSEYTSKKPAVMIHLAIKNF